jgi:hypothetical protein
MTIAAAMAGVRISWREKPKSYWATYATVNAAATAKATDMMVPSNLPTVVSIPRLRAEARVFPAQKPCRNQTEPLPESGFRTVSACGRTTHSLNASASDVRCPVILTDDICVLSNASRCLRKLSRKLWLVRELMPKSVIGFQQLSPGLRLSQPETFTFFLQLRMLPTKRRHCPVEGCAIVHCVVSLAFPK